LPGDATSLVTGPDGAWAREKSGRRRAPRATASSPCRAFPRHPIAQRRMCPKI